MPEEAIHLMKDEKKRQKKWKGVLTSLSKVYLHSPISSHLGLPLKHSIPSQ
jgi:hypothetical protein